MEDLLPLARQLTVTTEALKSLGITRNGTSWLIPERDATGAIIGQARRFDNGDKGFVTGGKRGLTYPFPLDNYAGSSMVDPVFVVEGMSDTAAGLSMGLDIVGRASALVGADELAILLKDRHVCIISENDDAGRKGAQSIAAKIVDSVNTLRIISPPPEHNDLRSWFAKTGGINKADLLQIVAETEEYTPNLKTSERRLRMRMGNTIDDQGMRYLWRRRIALGGPTIIFSRPGAGKSTIAAALTSHVTNGTPWPDSAPCERGSVVYIKGEGTDASIRDRMKNAGADASRYAVISRAEVHHESNESPMIDLAGDDANLLAHEIQMNGDVKLVIVDTLDSLYASMRMIDNANIRKCLWPMQELAEQLDIALVILAHTNKGAYHDPLDRLSGGRAIGGAARAVWYLGQQDRETDLYHMASVKVNDFKPEPSIEYRIVGTGPDTPGAIRWGEVAEDVSAWDLDNPPKGEGRSKTEACVEWMQDRLANGPELINPFKLACQDAGFGDHCYKKARRELEIESKPAKGSVPAVYWACMPDQTPPPTPCPPNHLTLDSEELSKGGIVKESHAQPKLSDP
jgi:hypothetical protein